MTQIVNPSIDRAADSFLTAGSLAYAGLRDGGIVPSGEVTELAKQSAIDETALDGFSFSTSSSSLDVTISPGEAFVFGSWLAKDTTTTVTLPPSSTVSGIILTWDKDSPNTVQIGLSSDFDEFPDPDEYLIVAGGFLTDENGVTQSNDPRKFVSIDAERLEGNETSEIKPDISDSGSTVVENAGDINVEGFSASNDGDGSATIVGAPQYTDTDAINAVDSESSLSVNIAGDANSVDGFSFVKDGNSGPGIINYQASIEASGGTTVIDRTINGIDYRIHAFESVGSSTFSVNQAPSDATVDVLIVGGGGGGGAHVGGGGGAGGVVFENRVSLSSGNYSVNVGGGGTGTSNNRDGFGKYDGTQVNTVNGEDSTFHSYTAFGGGGGGSWDWVNPQNGGSGGGESENQGPGLGTSGQGNDGGNARGDNEYGYPTGGGGGASSDGGDWSSSSAGNGGDGIDFSSEFSNNFGENGFFGGGGGGGIHGGRSNDADAGFGGLGGGGDGEDETSTPADNGLPNTGGGGGGDSGSDPSAGGDGGSGIVLIRYEI